MSQFKRSLLMMAAISSMISEGMGFAQIQASVGSYESRGKGRGTPSRNYFRGHASKYMPHQGEREIARRAARIRKLAGEVM